MKAPNLREHAEPNDIEGFCVRIWVFFAVLQHGFATAV